jgi:hypothetical protein
MIEFLKNVPNLEALFRHFLPNTAVRVKRKGFPAEFSDYGMMRIVSVIFHKDHSLEFGFTPADSTDLDDIHYYSLDEVDIIFDVSNSEAQKIKETHGHNFALVAPR